MKMKRTTITFAIILCCFSGKIYGQNLSLIQGIWSYNLNSDSSMAFSITKGNSSISFAIENIENINYNELDFPLSETIEGFQDNHEPSLGAPEEDMNISELKEDGLYYTIIYKEVIEKDGWVNSSDYSVPLEFECDGDYMSIYGGKLVEFYKIDRLPAITLKLLYLRGKQDHRNYIKEYLSIDVKEIVVPESIIYSEPDSPTTMHLIQGDIVTVLEGQDDWIKIEYAGEKLVTGWIKKEDVSD